MKRLPTDFPRRNPFISLLLLGGFAFVATAVLCGIAATDHYLAVENAAADVPSLIWQGWFPTLAPLLLAGEFAGLLATTFGVAYFEDARQAELDAARSTPQPRATC